MWNCRRMDHSPTVIKTIIHLLSTNKFLYIFKHIRSISFFLLYRSSSLSAYCLARHLLCVLNYCPSSTDSAFLLVVVHMKPYDKFCMVGCWCQSYGGSNGFRMLDHWSWLRLHPCPGRPSSPVLLRLPACLGTDASFMGRPTARQGAEKK